MLLVLEIIEIFSGLGSDKILWSYAFWNEVYYYTNNNFKRPKLMGMIILLSASAYFIIFWIWPSKVLITGLFQDCSKRFRPWIISMLGQSFLLVVFYFLVLPTRFYFIIHCYWLLIIVIVLSPQIIVWIVAIQNRTQEEEENLRRRRRPPVVTHPVSGKINADLPPSYNEVLEGDLPRYETISEKTREKVKYIYIEKNEWQN